MVRFTSVMVRAICLFVFFIVATSGQSSEEEELLSGQSSEEEELLEEEYELVKEIASIVAENLVEAKESAYEGAKGFMGWLKYYRDKIMKDVKPKLKEMGSLLSDYFSSPEEFVTVVKRESVYIASEMAVIKYAHDGEVYTRTSFQPVFEDMSNNLFADSLGDRFVEEIHGVSKN